VRGLPRAESQSSITADVGTPTRARQADGASARSSARVDAARRRLRVRRAPREHYIEHRQRHVLRKKRRSVKSSRRRWACGLTARCGGCDGRPRDARGRSSIQRSHIARITAIAGDAIPLVRIRHGFRGRWAADHPTADRQRAPCRCRFIARCDPAFSPRWARKSSFRDDGGVAGAAQPVERRDMFREAVRSENEPWSGLDRPRWEVTEACFFLFFFFSAFDAEKKQNVRSQW